MRTLIIAGVSAFALTLGGAAYAAGTGGAADHSELMKAQQKLQSEGLYKGKVDGIAGRETQAALKSFQKKNNLQQTGQLDKQTEAKLGITAESGSSMPSKSGGTMSEPAAPPKSQK